MGKKQLSSQAKEFFAFTMQHYGDEIRRISLSCISPIIAIRQVLRRALEDFQNQINICITQDEFHATARQILADKRKAAELER